MIIDRRSQMETCRYNSSYITHKPFFIRFRDACNCLSADKSENKYINMN